MPSSLLAALLSGFCGAAPAAAQDARPLEQRVVEHTLENGWRFLILPRRAVPVVSFETTIGVGAVDEPIGSTGMAHMFEHMAFKGSDRVGTTDWEAERAALELLDQAEADLLRARARGDGPSVASAEAAFRQAQERADAYVLSEEFSRMLEDAGGTGTLNALTSADETRYVVSLPANQVELWCWLEAERFARPVLREFQRERDAVLEERERQVDSNPFGVLLEELALGAYRAHPYGRPVIGFPGDIAGYTRAEAERFFQRNYCARRLTTAIVGDVDPATLIPMLERYFAGVPAGTRPKPVTTVEPPQRGERRIEVEFPAGPSVAIAWHVPALQDADTPAVELAVRLLGHSRDSRLVRRLVREDGTASAVETVARFGGDRYPSLALILAVPNSGVETGALEAAIYDEIRRLAQEGPGPGELERALRVARVEHLRRLRDNAAVAAGLNESHVKTGDWRSFFRQVERLEAVAAADVQRVLRTLFRRSNRTVATLMPPPEEEEE